MQKSSLEMKSGRALLALGLATLAAAKSGFGEACSQSNTHLDSDTWALDTDCDATTYCADNSTCAYKQCRRDTYPYGYNGVPFAELPPLCGEGQFCPDEGSGCLTQSAVGGQCQKDRDDECQLPPNYKDLAGYLNTNGSVCLNYQCYWSNVTLGQTCVNENTLYTAYTDAGSEYAFIISRDNCANGLYCDGTALQCIKAKLVGAACSGNKECLSYNCESNNKCGRAADEPIHPGSWVYAIIALGIIGFIVGVMVSLWFFHRRTRNEKQVKLEQYYNEQIAYRQSIMSMSHAKNSLLSLPANTHPEVARQSLIGEDAFAYTTATEPARNTLLPPNMRRESSAAFSDATDSEMLLMNEQQYSSGQNAPGRRRA